MHSNQEEAFILYGIKRAANTVQFIAGGTGGVTIKKGLSVLNELVLLYKTVIYSNLSHAQSLLSVQIKG